MSHKVVCISSQDGASAQEAAQLVAGSLGFRLIDEDIVARAAVEAGVDTGAVADVERRKSRLRKVLDEVMSAGSAGVYAIPAEFGGVYYEPGSDELRGAIRSVIDDIAGAGSAVIVSHAASLALTERADVLRVMITAPQQTRERRFAEEHGLDEKEAGRRIKRSDAGRADYIKRFYGIGAELPTHYDIVINTEKMSPEEAASLIVMAAGGGVQTEAPASVA